ncbi:MAG: hypothetical protein E6J41_28410 [Chloroflexi bacterium]|nr:MAG: hypothetical protein E6J41_28410 [Chloroflexota bacterium]
MIEAASDFCLRWHARRHSWRHRSEGGFDARRYDVAPLAESAARTFVEINHYAASYPAARLRFGLYDGPWLVGVAALGVPMQRRVLTAVFPDLEPYAESLELSRFVLAESVPANGESWFLARCWELAVRQGVRGVVSFSDPVPRRTATGDLVFPGHVGTIYQASNAAYLGRTTPRRVLLLPDGRVLSERALSKVRGDEQGHAYVERELVRFGARARRPGEAGAAWLREALAAAGVRSLVHGGNHRYAFRLGARRRLVAVGLPVAAYPKAVAA